MDLISETNLNLNSLEDDSETVARTGTAFWVDWIAAQMLENLGHDLGSTSNSIRRTRSLTLSLAPFSNPLVLWIRQEMCNQMYEYISEHNSGVQDCSHHGGLATIIQGKTQEF